MKKKIADIAWLNRFVEAMLEAWVRLAYRTSRWERHGFEDLEKVLQQGEPVIIILWHQRLMMSPYLLDPTLGPICTLTSASRAGRLAGNIVQKFGISTIAMSSHKRHVALTREVVRRIRHGSSVGMTADGPRGPARIASLAPITWARASQIRVFLVSFSACRVHALRTWDEMWLPACWTRGVLFCREWCEPLSRFSDEAETERLRSSLQTALNAVTDESDRAVGRQP